MEHILSCNVMAVLAAGCIVLHDTHTVSLHSLWLIPVREWVVGREGGRG